MTDTIPNKELNEIERIIQSIAENELSSPEAINDYFTHFSENLFGIGTACVLYVRIDGMHQD